MDYLPNTTIWVWIVTFAIVYLSYRFKRDPRIKMFVEKIPGPPTMPFIGNALSFARPNHELFDLLHTWMAEFGPAFRIWILERAYVICSSADAVEKVLSSNVHIEKSEDYSVLHPWLGTGLLTAAGKKWFTRRKLLTPAFHFKILDEFIDIFNEQSRILTDILKKERCDGGKFDIYPYVTKCALDIICETAMGKKIHAQQGKGDHATSYVNAIFGLNEVLLQRMIRVWLRPNLLWRISPQGRAEKKFLHVLHEFTEKVIEERKKDRRTEEHNSTSNENFSEDVAFETKRKRAFLDLLLEVSDNGKVLSDLDIREEVDTFMFEGHDTTSTSINFTLFLLASYPEHQKRVQDELDDIFGSKTNAHVSSNDLTRMKYLECCIKEALRLYPSVPFITRNLKQDLVFENGRQTIPAGCTAVVAPYILHREKAVFPNPENFDPERFLPENCIGRHPFAYVPFSAGPRNCIGQKFALMEEKVILSHVLRKFQLQAVSKRDSSMKLLPNIILRSMNGLLVKISERC